jgi:hypothetical protein
MSKLPWENEKPKEEKKEEGFESGGVVKKEDTKEKKTEDTKEEIADTKEKNNVVDINKGKDKNGHNAFEREIIKSIDIALNGEDNDKPPFGKNTVIKKYENTKARLIKLNNQFLNLFGVDCKPELVYNSIMDEKKKQMRAKVDEMFRGANFFDLVCTEIYLGFTTMQNYASQLKHAIEKYNSLKVDQIDDKKILKNMIIEAYKNAESWGAESDDLLKMITELPEKDFGKGYQEIVR